MTHHHEFEDLTNVTGADVAVGWMVATLLVSFALVGAEIFLV